MSNAYKPIELKNGKLSEKLNHQNFSYYLIDEDLLIPLGQQMIVKDRFEVLNGFGLNIQGQAYLDVKQEAQIIPDPEPDNHSYFRILNGETKEIRENQEQCLSNFFKVENGGQLLVKGKSSVVNTYIEPVVKRVPKIVLEDESYVVQDREEYYFRSWWSVSGQVLNKGFIFIGE